MRAAGPDQVQAAGTVEAAEDDGDPALVRGQDYAAFMAAVASSLRAAPVASPSLL